MRFSAVLLSKLKDFSNLPASYVERITHPTYWKTPSGKPNYLRKEIRKEKVRYTTNRPWTAQFQKQNIIGKIRKKVFIEPTDWSFFRGDRVEVLVGKDKGKQGIINQVIPERNWVIVEGLNCHYRKVGATEDYPGILIKSEAPLLVDKHVCLVDPSDLKSTLAEWRYTEEGERVRVSMRTGRIIPIPQANEETHDYKTKSSYVEKEKDTPGDVVTEVTFKPTLQTFEMELMKELGIEETRIPKKTWWY